MFFNNKFQKNYLYDLLIIVVGGILVYQISQSYDFCEIFTSHEQANAFIKLDEIFFTSIFVLCGLVVFSIRRYFEFKSELKKSTEFQTKLINVVNEREKIEENLRLKEYHSNQILLLVKQLEYADSYEEVLIAVKKVLHKSLGYRTVWFYKFSEDRKTAELIFSGKIPNQIRKMGAHLINIEKDPYYSRISSSFDVDIVADAVTYELTASKKFIQDLKIHTLVHIPLILHNSSIGLLGTCSFGKQGVIEPTNLEIEFLLNLSGHVALALYKIQVQSERLKAEEAQKISEEKYRNLVEQSSSAIYLISEGQYEFVNNNFLNLFGITREDINNGSFSILKYAHPDSIPFLKERQQKALDGKALPSTYEYTAFTKDKKTLELEASISYTEVDGKLQIQGILKDISSRKSAEKIQDAIYQISEATIMTNNLNDLIAKIHSIIKSIMYAENLFVEFYDKKTNLYSSAYFVDQVDIVEEETSNLTGSLTDYIRKTEKAAIIDAKKHTELAESGQAKYFLTPAKSWMGAPLKTHHGVIGVIAVQSYEDTDLYTQKDLDLLNLISGQIAFALEKKRAEEEQQKSRDFFKTVIDSLDNPLYVINIEDKSIPVANTAAKKLILTNNIVERGCYDREFKNRKSCPCSTNTCVVSKLLKTKKPVQYEQIFNNEDNSISTYHVYAFPIIDEDGTIIQIIENLVDISERKRFEKKLSELAVFPESNPNIVMSINSNQEIIYMNSATISVLSDIGVSKDELQTCLPPSLDELVETMLREGSGLSNIRVEIKSHILSWSFHPVFGQDIIHCYAIDITQQVKQVEEIKKLSMVATQSSTIITVTNAEGVIEYVNPYFTTITGYSNDEVVGLKISELKSGNNSKELYQDLWNTIRSGNTWNGKIKNKKKNGELYWESKTISPIKSETGEIISYISVGSDITKEIHIQSKLVESEKFSAIATLAAGVAHEFKNYLGGIIGNASFTLDEIDSQDALPLAKDTLLQIIEMGEKANDVAMSLLTFSKAKPEDLQKEDLKKIINQSITLVEKELETLSIEIVTYFEDVPPIEVSLSKIQQLLLNLFINAKHAISSNGVLSISLVNKGDKVEIRIGDTGGGIKKEHLDKIFDPFYSTKGVWGNDKVSGTGMGLSICRNIALEHNGDLTVKTIKGIGTTFTISLPVSNTTEIYIDSNKQVEEKDVLFFTLNNSIISHYYDDICSSLYNLIIVDDYYKIEKSMMRNVAFVVCDAKYSAKVELYRMVEFCIQNNYKYIMINCGTMEYQLAELYEDSVTNYKELPSFQKVITDFTNSKKRIST